MKKFIIAFVLTLCIALTTVMIAGPPGSNENQGVSRIVVQQNMTDQFNVNSPPAIGEEVCLAPSQQIVNMNLSSAQSTSLSGAEATTKIGLNHEANTTKTYSEGQQPIEKLIYRRDVYQRQFQLANHSNRLSGTCGESMIC